MAISLAEFRAKLDEFDQVVDATEKEQKTVGETLADLKEAAPTLLKTHQSIVGIQKASQAANVRAEEVRTAVEKLQADLATLNQEVQKNLAAERTARADSEKMCGDDIKLAQQEVAGLEKRLALNIQESETNALEGLAKLAGELENQAEGYKDYMMNHVDGKVRLPSLEAYKASIVALKSQFNAAAIDEQKSISPAGSVQSGVEEKVKARYDEIRKEFQVGITQLQELKEAIRGYRAGVPAPEESAHVLLQSAQRLVENVVADYDNTCEPAEAEIDDKAFLLGELLIARAETKAEFDPAAFKEQLASCRLKIKDKKAQDAALLGQLSRYMQDMISNGEGSKTVSDVVAFVRKERELLEGNADRSVEVMEKRLGQIEARVDAAQKLWQSYFVLR